MTEETKVSHDDLDAAAEEVDTEPEVAAAEEPEVEVAAVEATVEEEPAFVPAEPDDNDERSMLGRKVKAIGDQLDTFSNQLAPILARFDNPEVEGEEDDIITTKADVIKVLRTENEQATAKKAVYAKTVESALIDIGLAEGLDEDTHIAVFKDAQANWNGKTGNAAIDAELNFKDALIRHNRKEMKKASLPVNPLEKNKDKEEDLGGPAETAVKPKKVAVPEMDDYAKDFVTKTGMKPESVAEALTGDAPTYLLGKG
jgi:hypothetical protein